MKKRNESSLVTAIGNYLQNLENNGVIAFWSRQQAGTIMMRGGAGRFYKIRQGREGISDLWCIPYQPILRSPIGTMYTIPMIWIECKTDDGKQSPAQVEFQHKVDSCGHFYLIIHDCDELEREFIRIGVIEDAKQTQTNPKEE